MTGAEVQEPRISGLLPDLFRRPITSLTCVLAVAITVASWGDLDVSALVMSSRAFTLEPWRLVTSAFLHANFVHLAFNVSWVWPFGRVLEARYGPLRTAALFLVLAIGSSTAEYAFARGGVGLSGVVYGQFGMLWVSSRRDARLAGAVKPGTVRIFVVWFFVCVLLTATHVLEIGNIAHASGWGLGMLIGWAVYAGPERKHSYYAVIGSVFVLLVTAATVGRPYVNFDGGIESESAYEGFRALEAGDNERAARLLETAVARDASRVGWWVNLGCAYVGLGRETDAGVAFDRAFRLEPGNETVRKNWIAHKDRLAWAAYERGEWKAAEALYRESIALDADDADAWQNLGATLHGAGRYGEALQAYRRALALTPSNAELRTTVDELEAWIDR